MSKAADQPKKGVGSVFDLPGKSVRIVKENWQMFALVNILAILSGVFQALSIGSDAQNKRYGSGAGDFSGISSSYEITGVLGLGLVIGIVLLFAAIFLYAMSTGLAVRSSKGEKPNFDTLLDDGKKNFFRLFGLTVVVGLIVVVGLVLLIVPGVIAITKLAMSPYHMLDKNLGIVDAMKASNEQSKGHAGHIWAAIGVIIGIALLVAVVSSVPFLGPLVGTAATIAFSLVLVLRYRELKTIAV